MCSSDLTNFWYCSTTLPNSSFVIPLSITTLGERRRRRVVSRPAFRAAALFCPSLILRGYPAPNFKMRGILQKIFQRCPGVPGACPKQQLKIPRHALVAGPSRWPKRRLWRLANGKGPADSVCREIW